MQTENRSKLLMKQVLVYMVKKGSLIYCKQEEKKPYAEKKKLTSCGCFAATV